MPLEDQVEKGTCEECHVHDEPEEVFDFPDLRLEEMGLFDYDKVWSD